MIGGRKLANYLRLLPPFGFGGPMTPSIFLISEKYKIILFNIIITAGTNHMITFSQA
jgi:hypothetical protein